MATINSPGKILKLWHKVQDRYGVDEKDKDAKKKIGEKDKAAAKQGEKITKGMTVLQAVTKGGVRTPGQVKQFETTRSKVVTVMKKYCKTIKAVKLEGAQDMNKLRTSVKQLTLVVEGLLYQHLSDEETGDADLKDIAGIDTSALDKAMEEPNFAAGPDDDIKFDEADESQTEEEPASKPPVPSPSPGKAPVPPPADGSATTKRLNALAPGMKAALAGPEGARVQTLFATVGGFIKKKDYVQAGKTLDELEPLVKTVPQPPLGGAKGADLTTALAQWTTARAKVIESLKALEGHIRAMKDPRSDGAIILVKAIQANLTARPDSAQAVVELERYIGTDQIIKDAEDPNGFGIKITIRSTLLPVLAGVRAALSV